MASTFTLSSHSVQTRYLYLECTQSKDIASNKSTISWKLSSLGGTSNNYTTGPTTVTIGGVQVYYSGRIEWDTGLFPSARGSVSGTTSVSHDTLGNKTVEVVMTTMIFDGVSRTVKGSWTLDSIPRQATITSASSFTDSDNPGISFSNPGGFPMHVWLEPNPVGTHRCERNNIPNTGSYTWSLSATERDELRSACAGNKCTIRVGLYTNINGTLYSDYRDVTYTMVESTATRPSVSMSISPNSNVLPSVFNGLYIQGKSRVNVSVSASGKYGASISSYSLNVGDKTYSSTSYASELVTKSGTISITGYAKDSRGFTGSASGKITVIPYSAPWITSFAIERQADSTTVIARLQGGISPVENKNTKAFSVTLNGITKDVPATGYDVDGSVTFTDIPTDVTLTAEARVTDAFSTAAKQAAVPTVAVTMDFHNSGKGAAFGKVAEYANLLDIAWDTAVKGTLTANHIARIDDYGAKDFNSLVYNTGYYTSGGTPASTGCKNYPIDVTGMLEVISQIFTNATTGNKWGFAYQTYRTYTGDIYTRSYYTDTGFTPWKKIQFV